jgi:MinD superfamily P-loop ATPase
MIISVASGKGGTGKTLVAVSLALEAVKQGPVKLLDCDVEEPNAHLLLPAGETHEEPVEVTVPVVNDKICDRCRVCESACAYNAISVLADTLLVFEPLCHGCGACLRLCPHPGALTEKKRAIGRLMSSRFAGLDLITGELNVGEARATPVIAAVKAKLPPRDADQLCILDCPPGTSCPVIAAVKDTDFCLLVTEPTPFGLHDLGLAVDMARNLRLACGVVINRAGEHDRLIEDYCFGESIPVLAKIPLDVEIARAYSRGEALDKSWPAWTVTSGRLLTDIKELVHARITHPQR